MPIPANDLERVAALRALQILDTPPEQQYDDLALLAAALCGTPMAMVNLVDRDRLWSKALVGLDAAPVSRADSFCARTIVADDGTLVVPDAREDPRWAGLPSVVGPPHLRFYAGAAIVSPEGYALGSVCVADREPRAITPEALGALRALARQAAALLELHRTARMLVAAAAELHRLAVEDALTGLANRTLLHDRLAHALRMRERTGRDVGVLFCDLDEFKAVNDRHGHQAGDELLRIVADRLAGIARGSDTVARYAGDEFVVVCPDLAAGEDIHPVRLRLQAAVEQPATVDGTTLVPQVSVGAVVAATGEDAAAVLRRADGAMYADKPITLR